MNENFNSHRIVLQTKRLAAAIPGKHSLTNRYKLLTAPEVTKYIGNGLVKTEKQVFDFCHKNLEHFTKYGFCLFDIFEKESNHFIGDAGLIHSALNDENKEIEIGYRLLEKFWYKGYATEITEAFLKWGFDKHNLSTILAYVNPKNIASGKVLKKCQMEYKGKTFYPSPGAKQKCDLYYKYNIILETDAFYLRPFIDEDLNLLHALRSEPLIQKSLQNESWNALDTKNRLKILTSKSLTGITKFAIFIKSTNTFIGYCGFSMFYKPDFDPSPIIINDPTIELGYVLHPQYWGQGYSTTVAGMCIKWIFEHKKSITQIVAVTTVANVASQRVLQKIGFKYIKDITSKKLGLGKFFLLSKNDL